MVALCERPRISDHRDPALNVTAPADAAAPNLLLNVEQVAAMLGCSPRHVYRLCDADRMSRPVRLGALVRWPRAEIQAWVAQGCPRPQRSAR